MVEVRKRGWRKGKKMPRCSTENPDVLICLRHDSLGVYFLAYIDLCMCTACTSYLFIQVFKRCLFPLVRHIFVSMM